MNLKSKIKIILALFIIFMGYFTIKSLAVSISVSPSVGSIEPGGSFSVTISGNDATGRVNISVSGGTASSSSVWVENNSQTITVTAGTSGSVRISASGELSSNSGEDKNVSNSASVTINEPVTTIENDPVVVDTKPAKNPGNTSAQKPAPVQKEEEKKSSEASLKELVVAEGTITPEFNAEVYEYNLTVPNEITSLNISTAPLDNNASVTIEGNENFVVGENKVLIKVVAEDGTVKEYYINVTRKRTNLALQTLKITYVDKEGNIQELELNPNFNASVLEYKLNDISYLINYLNVEATANLEGAIIEISGNDDLKEGANVITIKLTMKAEPVAEGKEQEEDEVIIYTIKVNKEKEPTFWEKVKNRIKTIFGGFFKWYDNNRDKVVVYSLIACVVALIGLAIYIIVDYKKYKTLIIKLKKLESINDLEPVEESDTNINNQVLNIEQGVKARSGKHF